MLVSGIDWGLNSLGVACGRLALKQRLFAFGAVTLLTSVFATGSAFAQSTCAGFNETTHMNNNGFHSTGLVTVNSGDTVSGNVVAPAGAKTDVYFLAGSDVVFGSGAYSIAISGSGGASVGSVDFGITGLGSGETATATGSCSSGGGGSTLGDVAGTNLEDIFPETRDGDLIGKYGIEPADFGDDEDDKDEDEKDEGNEPGTGPACGLCQSELSALRARARSVQNSLNGARSRRASLQGASGNDPTLKAESLGIDQLKANNPLSDKLGDILGQRSQASEALAGWIRNNPKIAAAVGLNKGSGGPGDLGSGDQGYFGSAMNNISSLAQEAGEGHRISSIQADEALTSTLFGVAELGIGLAETIASGGVMSPGAAVAALQTIYDVYETSQATSRAEAERLVNNRIVEGSKLVSRMAAINGFASAVIQKIDQDAAKDQAVGINKLVSDLGGRIVALQSRLNTLNTAISSKQRSCARVCQTSASVTQPQSNSTMIASFSEQSRPTQFHASAKNIRITGSTVSTRFSLREIRKSRKNAGGLTGWQRGNRFFTDLPGFLQDERLNVFGAVSFSRSFDSRPSGQQGNALSVSGGASWMLRPKLNIGVALAYADSDVAGTTNSMATNTWSLAAFAQTKIAGGWNLEAVGSYGHSSIASIDTSAVLPVTADFNAIALATQIKLSRSFKVKGISIAPYGSATYVHSVRNAFSASDGSSTAAASTNSVIFSGGASAGYSFKWRKSDIVVSPSFSAGLSGSAGSSLGYSLGAGFGIKSPRGMTGGLSVGYSGTGASQSGYTIAANLTIPLGRK